MLQIDLEFYKEVSGWKIQKQDNNENPEKEYLIFETKDGKGSPKIGGGLMKRQTFQHIVTNYKLQITNYIIIFSMEAYSSKIEQSGDKVIISKTKVPYMEFISVCLDGENKMFGIYEGDESA